jgi:PBSX family phage terminase large subunit
MATKLNYGPRLERFAMRPPEQDAKINLLVGSVRSGKTFALHPKILALCDYPVQGRRLLTGVSKSSIKTNVLTDLFDLIGKNNYHYNSQSGELRLFKSDWLVYGAKDEGSEKYIRGATIGAAVADEVVLMPQSYFQMLLTRMSPPGARLYGSTNADSPYHWLKTEYLDNAQLIRDRILWWDTFQMSDNPSLDQAYVAAQKNLYTGVFYRRMILGEFCMASGAIYLGAWTDANLYDDRTRPRGLYSRGGTEGYTGHIIGVDYGTRNPTVFLDGIDDGRTLWVDNEYYWDSVKEMRQKTDGELADDLEKFIKESNCPEDPKIIVDPSAASFKAELLRRGMWVVDADNDVMEHGIRNTASFLHQKKIRFQRERCVKSPGEFQSYSWDKKKSDNGTEQPIKKHDHCPDTGRYMVNDVCKDSWRLSA